MSALTEELDVKVIRAWRRFAESNEFQLGIDWLRHNRATESGDSDMQLVKTAAKWRGYMDALDDIQDKLTEIPAKDTSLDEPPLNSP